MRGEHHVASIFVVGLLGPAAGCQAHAVSHSTGESSSSEDDGDPEPGPSPVPTSDPGTTAATTTAATTTADTEETSETSGTGDASSTTTTTGTPGICGNGLLDPGETCDLGFAGNSDEGACTQSCQQAYCGDGLVWVGEELCDEGPNNNDQTYNGCQRACTPGPRCGDGALQLEEECDPSAPKGENVVSCDPDSCRFNARVAFVTSMTFVGDFGGLAEADAACAAAAANAGLDNASNFLAWLSDGVTGPAERFTKPAPGYPYARRDGQQLAYDLDTLYAQGLQVPLDITELGTTLPPEDYAWTNTKFNGQPLSPQDHCQVWTSETPKQLGRAGQVSPPAADLPTWLQSAHWTQYAALPCNFSHRLYCFEQ